MRLVPALAVLGALATVYAAGCGTDAVGVDQCREIEQTRCDYAVACGLTDDIDACKLFYRDQCLHGLAVGQPSRLELNLCVQTIKNAGECAKKDNKATLQTCAATKGTTQDGAMPVCDVIVGPETTVECSFLAEVPAKPVPDASDGAAGASGDAASE